MRPRARPSPRCLDASEREELLALIDAVPPDADARHPEVIALRVYCERLRDHVPWWAPSGVAYLRSSDSRRAIEHGLDLMRQLAALDDWGTDPTEPCDCVGCRRRSRFGAHHTVQEYARLGLFCERRAVVASDRMFA